VLQYLGICFPFLYFNWHMCNCNIFVEKLQVVLLIKDMCALYAAIRCITIKCKVCTMWRTHTLHLIHSTHNGDDAPQNYALLYSQQLFTALLFSTSGIQFTPTNPITLRRHFDTIHPSTIYTFQVHLLYYLQVFHK
jgi:hypothetical protein